MLCYYSLNVIHHLEPLSHLFSPSAVPSRTVINNYFPLICSIEYLFFPTVFRVLFSFILIRTYWLFILSIHFILSIFSILALQKPQFYPIYHGIRIPYKRSAHIHTPHFSGLFFIYKFVLLQNNILFLLNTSLALVSCFNFVFIPSAFF